jgi:precorrin-3B synthase
MTQSRRRGACPGLSAPMPTGDGLLVRLMPAAPVPTSAMAGLCAAARRHGNGTVEITARGSVQVRGLTLTTAPLFAAAVAELGIAAHEGVPVIAAVDDAAADLVAMELRREIASAGLALSPKVSVVVDGDGRLHLDGLSADVRLRAVGPAQGPQSSPPPFHLGVGGSPRWLGTVAQKDAAGAVVSILKIIAAHGAAVRAADILARDGVAAFPVPAVDQAPAPPPRMAAEMIGRHAMRDGMAALGVGLAFGHAHADALSELIGVAARYGVCAARPLPDRALLLTGMPAPNARDLAIAAERLGFVVQADDPRRRIAACPGSPGCASGLIPARALASALAPLLAAVPAERDGAAVHISGCPKGCAHPAPAPLTVVGTPQGCGIVRGGAACAAPHHHADPGRLGDEVLRLAATSAEVAHG